jgi:hypothetical protein
VAGGFGFFEKSVGNGHRSDEKGKEEVEIGLERFEVLGSRDQRVGSSHSLYLSELAHSYEEEENIP